MRHYPITVSELIQTLQNMPGDMPVHMSMNMEYQSRVCSDFVELFTREDGSQYVLITDCPGSRWDEDYSDSYHDELERDHDEPYEPDGQPDEAQEWHDFDPDC